MSPLASNVRLKRTLTGQILFTKAASFLGRPVAWVTSGSPVEILLAAGVIPFYPENHAALCSSQGMGATLSEHAEAERYSRDLCAYFRIDLGSVVSGRTPLGKLVKPDLILACNNICGTVQHWFRIVADRFGVPFLFVDTPFSEREPSPSDVAYVADQLRSLATDIGRITGSRVTEKRLTAVAHRSAEALRLWAEVLGTGRHRPAPFSSFDAFVHMSPIVSMRGTRRAIRYYRSLLREIEARVAAGRAAVPGETGRVVWDNIAIWPVHRELKRLFRDNRVTLVADSYTSAWSATGLDADDPYAGLARAYCDILLNHGAGHRTAVLTRLVRDFSADGFILHSNRSCKRYSLGQYGVRRRVAEATGVPGLVIEADMADPRAVSFDNLKQRLLPFFEAVRK